MTTVENPDLSKIPGWQTKTYSKTQKQAPVGFCVVVEILLVKFCGHTCSAQLKGWSTMATTLLQTKIQQVIPIPPKKRETRVRGEVATPAGGRGQVSRVREGARQTSGHRQVHCVPSWTTGTALRPFPARGVPGHINTLTTILYFSKKY